MSFSFPYSNLSGMWHRSRLALLLCVALSGCVGLAGGERQAPAIGDDGEPADGDLGDDGDDDLSGGDDLDVSPADQMTRERCRAATISAQTALETHCASCHGAGAQGGFGSVLDLNVMIDEGRIVAGKPESSPVYAKISSGAMPPASVSKRPTAQEVANVHDWIECGAPALARAADAPAFVDIDERLETMLADLRSFENPADRKEIRYIDLYNLANAGFSEAELEVYREAVAFLLNSLSHGRRAVTPQRVDDRGLMFRVELRDYGWTTETWANIARDYPYAVQYEKDSRLFPFDEVSADQIRQETGEPVAFIQGDWFVAHCIRPPLYYEILGVPQTLSLLEQELDVNIAANIASGEVARAGFRQAESSQNDRVVERHESSEGALWVSYDFASGIGNADVFAHPLDFEADGIQVAYTLPNGLQGYAVYSAEGARLDKAPNNVAQDPHSRDGAVEPGISCISCHGSRGVMERTDEVRTSIESTAEDAAQIEAVLALYTRPAEMSALFGEDQARYEAARSLVATDTLADLTMHQIDDRYLDVLDLTEVSAVLGVPEADVRRALTATPADFPASLRSLRNDGAVVPRDGFDAVFSQLVEALGLGNPYAREELLGGGAEPAPEPSEDDSGDAASDDGAADDTGEADGAASDGVADSADGAVDEGTSTDGSSTDGDSDGWSGN